MDKNKKQIDEANAKSSVDCPVINFLAKVWRRLFKKKVKYSQATIDHFNMTYDEICNEEFDIEHEGWSNFHEDCGDR